MYTDAKQTEFCTYLSAALLGGLFVGRALGSVVGGPSGGAHHDSFIAKEGIEGLKGKVCDECSTGAA